MAFMSYRTAQTKLTYSSAQFDHTISIHEFFSTVSIDFVSEQQRPWSDCTNVQAGMDMWHVARAIFLGSIRNEVPAQV